MRVAAPVVAALALLPCACRAWQPTVQSLGRKAIIGYWGSAADKPKEPQLAEALKRGYNVISVAFGDTLTADGGFQIHTNVGDPPAKAQVAKEAGVSVSSFQYLLSFGGQNAAGPAISDVDGYANGFLSNYEKVHEKCGFDGIDVDIETGMSTPLLKAFRKIFQALHDKGQVISMAPQPGNIDPGEVPSFSPGSWNGYVPLIDTSIIDTVNYVAVQMYNNAMPMGSLESYLGSLQKGTQIAWEGQQLEVRIPSEKLVFGFPAAQGAAPAGPAQPWELPASSLAAKYLSSPALMATGGCMTWSIGWDASEGWSWISAVAGIWKGTTVVV